MRRRLTRIVAATPLPRFGAHIHRHHVAVIAYHSVDDQAAFASQLAALADRVSFIGPDDLRRARLGAPLPPRPTLVTFDDGDRSVLERGVGPIVEAGIRPMLFVCGGLIGTHEPFWWETVAQLDERGAEQVEHLKLVPDRERRAAVAALRSGAPEHRGIQLTADELHTLIAAGFEIGNHSWDHPCLDRCDAEEVVRQITDSHQALVDRGIRPTAFAYPNGNMDRRAEPILAGLGYDLGFAHDDRHAGLDQHRYRISRLFLKAHHPPERAILAVSGIYGGARRLARR